jgi:hypothetical protein
MYERFSPNLNLSPITFAMNLSLALNVHIDTSTIFPPASKARYSRSRYNVGQYDPYAPIGIQIADKITAFLYGYMVRHFVYGNQRGYKYSLAMALGFLHSCMPTLEQFAPEKVWITRFKKIEGWRNWTAFYNLAFYNVNIYPTDKVLIRVTDNPTNYGKTVTPREVLDDQLSSNAYNHGVYDHTYYPGDINPYDEVWLMVPNLTCYESLYHFANYNYDLYYQTAVFDPHVLTEVIEAFRAGQNPAYRQLLWFTGGERMKAMYTVHGSYQANIRAMIEKVLDGDIQSPMQIPQYYAFALEYVYARKFMQLVDAEKVIRKWVLLGLSDMLLRRVAASIQR